MQGGDLALDVRGWVAGRNRARDERKHVAQADEDAVEIGGADCRSRGRRLLDDRLFFLDDEWVTGGVVAALGGGPNESTGEGCAGESAEDACDAAAAAE